MILRWVASFLMLMGSVCVAAQPHSLSSDQSMPLVTHTSKVKLVIFGDSLSDNGNSYEFSHHQKPAAPTYYQGRFSDGPIWIDYVANLIFLDADKQKILNYAFGGAGVLHSQPHVFILSQEIDSYLLTHSVRPDTDTWFILWIGANDYLLHPDSNETDVNKVVTEIDRNLSRLQKHGAQHIVVMGLPDLGVLPYANDLEVQSSLSMLTRLHNQQLKNRITQLQNQYPQLTWNYIDVNQTFTTLMQHPKQYGFTYTQTRCYVPDISEQIAGNKTGQNHVQNNCRKYVFFDQFHPTTFVHQILAKELLKNIKF